MGTRVRSLTAAALMLRGLNPRKSSTLFPRDAFEYSGVMQLTDMTWPSVDRLSRDIPVLIPIAALEQHGHHMPVFTDSLLLGEVVRRIHDALPDELLVAPLMWLGNSEHHLDFPGTMTHTPRGYLDLLKGMVENFLFHGFRRIMLLNGHGGNMVPSQQALFEVRQEHRERDDLLLLSGTYWTLGDPPSAEKHDLKQRQMGHAGEWETSMMLRIRPDLVRDHTATEEVPFGGDFAPAHQAWITKDRSATGHIGLPQHATAEKGEALLSAFADNAITLLKRITTWDGVSEVAS